MTGTVVLSVEIELAWGLARLDDATAERHGRHRSAETETLERLLAACDERGLPITFDVVGHLLLERCTGAHDGPVPDDWFADDPGTSADDDPLYYAPDLAEQIRTARVGHEVGTHTFTHPRCDLVDDEVVDWELRAARDAHDSAGLSQPRSFVPPLHGPPPSSVLCEHGVTGVREPVTLRPPVEQRSPPESPLASLAWRLRESHPAQVLARSHPVREPELRDGLVRHYSTWHASLTAPHLPNGASAPHPAYRVLPTRVRQAIHERYLERALEDAVAADSCVHLWTHLFNLANDAQWSPVRSFLDSLADRRDAGDLTVETMASLSEQVVAADA